MNYIEIMGLSLECYTSIIELKNHKEALSDEFKINAMHEELSHFKCNKVRDLVSKPQHANVIGTKWIFKNKIDEKGNITINKA